MQFEWTYLPKLEASFERPLAHPTEKLFLGGQLAPHPEQWHASARNGDINATLIVSRISDESEIWEYSLDLSVYDLGLFVGIPTMARDLADAKDKAERLARKLLHLETE